MTALSVRWITGSEGWDNGRYEVTQRGGMVSLLPCVRGGRKKSPNVEVKERRVGGRSEVERRLFFSFFFLIIIIAI